MDFSLSKAIGGALLVAGTAIGAGMLALPVVTGMGGFFPTTVIYLICWLFSTCTGLLILEVCLWMPNDANMITMAQRLLGPVGKIVAWVLYLFLFYCLTIAYVAAGGGLFQALTEGKIPHVLSLILFSVVFGFFVYKGTRVVDRLNFILMIGLGLSFLAFVILGVSKVNLEFLVRSHWTPAFLALPIIFTSFSFQGIVPSLTTYLDRNPKMVRFAIVVGTSLPFLGYLLWEYLILGIIPLDGPHGLLRAQALGQTAVEPLRFIFPGSSIYMIGQFFGAFALITSFLGVTLGLLDFLADGLQIAKKGWKKLGLCALIYIPPIIIVGINPFIFLDALGYAGGIGCALLLGIFPVLMVWVGRYCKGYPSIHRQLPGGKILLGCLGAFVIFELFIEFSRQALK